MVGPGAKRALAAASLNTSAGTTATSNGEPAFTRAMMLGVESKWIDNLYPDAFPNGAARAFIGAVIEPPAMTLSSAASRGVKVMANIADSRITADFSNDWPMTRSQWLSVRS